MANQNKSIKYPKLFKTPVNIENVNMKIMKSWFTSQLQVIVPDDDIIIEFLEELLIQHKHPDIKSIYQQLATFIDDDDQTMEFCKKLWQLLVDAQQDPQGIPQELIEKRLDKVNQDQRLSKDLSNDSDRQNISNHRIRGLNPPDRGINPRDRGINRQRTPNVRDRDYPTPRSNDRSTRTSTTSSKSVYNAAKRLETLKPNDNIDINRF